MFRPNVQAHICQIGLEKVYLNMMWSLVSPCSLHRTHILGTIYPLLCNWGHVRSALLLSSHKNILTFGGQFVFHTQLVLDTNIPLFMKWQYVALIVNLPPMSYVHTGLSPVVTIGAYPSRICLSSLISTLPRLEGELQAFHLHLGLTQ